MPQTTKKPARRRGTPPSRKSRNLAQATVAETAAATAASRAETDNQRPLEQFELRKLYGLHWTKADAARIGPAAARLLIKSKQRKTPEAAMLADTRLNEEREAARPEPTPGLAVGVDDFTQRTVGAAEKRKQMGGFPDLGDYDQPIIEGADQIDAILREYAANYPGKRFRLINPNLPRVASGPPWQMVHDAQGKQVVCGDLVLGWMPEDVYDEYYRKPNLERSRQMDSKIQRNTQDADLSMQPEEAMLAPILAEQLGPDGNMHAAGVVREVRAAVGGLA